MADIPRMQPPPDWTAIFSVHYELDPPGYAETLIRIKENPYVNSKDRKTEEAAKKKKSKGLGRGQKA